MSMLSIVVGDGEIHEYATGTTAGEVIHNVHGRKSGAVAALIDGIECDMNHELSDGQTVTPILGESEAGLYILRHSCAHLLAQAILEFNPAAKPTIGPPIENGFYYDFHMDPISDEDLRLIEKRMKELVKANLKVEREEHDNATLRSMFADNPFKIEIMDEKIGEGAGSSVYRQGDFVDLCRGPHVPTTAMLRWFKLTSTSTCYWKADASRESLVRIYGWCFANKQDLQNHETLMREAGKRDHRKLGKELQLFHIDEMVGQGLILWTPRGSVVRNELQDFISSHLRRQGYDQVYTPHIGKLDLYRTSGHYPYYQESQYPPLISADQIADLAEGGHSRRTRRGARLAFGPLGQARVWTRIAPPIRVLALTAMAWGLVTLFFIRPRMANYDKIPEGGYRHLIIAWDVSPSMQLDDGGFDSGKQKKRTRAQRGAKVLLSLFERIALDQVRISSVAFFTGAKPVVVDTHDLNVVKNILDDLPLDMAFDPGKPAIMDGIREAVSLARDWPAGM